MGRGSKVLIQSLVMLMSKIKWNINRSRWLTHSLIASHFIFLGNYCISENLCSWGTHEHTWTISKPIIFYVLFAFYLEIICFMFDQWINNDITYKEKKGTFWQLQNKIRVLEDCLKVKLEYHLFWSILFAHIDRLSHFSMKNRNRLIHKLTKLFSSGPDTWCLSSMQPSTFNNWGQRSKKKGKPEVKIRS